MNFQVVNFQFSVIKPGSGLRAEAVSSLDTDQGLKDPDPQALLETDRSVAVLRIQIRRTRISGSFYHQAKIVRNTLIFAVL